MTEDARAPEPTPMESPDEQKNLDDLDQEEAEAADVKGGQRAFGARWPGQRA